ncbi:hypothetical protein GCM10022198_08380 [Klugiella xanthotipulae]|uniref:Sec-independent protein translocase protein TatA n=1 Tax=Klugiella xanthotipulae TaxID=244735 RepID=A0A543HSU6_9MICO|nr:twin-arginine translocase TatA/TatE family subunit [Klugiella xanthotipulae]TQM61403.1 sec-independent protein translocase protein TatA [Klugiella xanthotipulae]
MLAGLTGWHALIIVVIILLLFGAPKLPGLARSMGQSMKIFRNEIKSDKKPEDLDADSSDAPSSRTETDTTNKQ